MDAETFKKTMKDASEGALSMIDKGYDLTIFWMFIDDKYSDKSIGVRLEFKKVIK